MRTSSPSIIDAVTAGPNSNASPSWGMTDSDASARYRGRVGGRVPAGKPVALSERGCFMATVSASPRLRGRPVSLGKLEILGELPWQSTAKIPDGRFRDRTESSWYQLRALFMRHGVTDLPDFPCGHLPFSAICQSEAQVRSRLAAAISHLRLVLADPPTCALLGSPAEEWVQCGCRCIRSGTALPNQPLALRCLYPANPGVLRHHDGCIGFTKSRSASASEVHFLWPAAG
ncbi:hypothetical protein VTN77DRAFT_6792 [Rasamsonia byssochlamydoides]|uniref:uncharacterized protein n=1 Tax=Rasamsonia byssochlamydoides TaxID=89139 RepID=UPI0037425A9B